MPTIDQLAPANSASDSDELIVSQAGVTRKISRTQVLNGYQTNLFIGPNQLLGRASSGVGAPEVISLGANLVLNGNTLAAASVPFSVNGLVQGLVPNAADRLPMAQGGTNVAISYGDFFAGFSRLTNVDLSNGLISAGGTLASQTLASFASGVLPRSGGSLSGALVLAGDPVASAQAATKNYVDIGTARAVPLAGGSMTGALSLSVTPSQPAHATTKAYVDGAVATLLPTAGGSLTGSLSLKADPTTSLQAATKSYVDQKVARAGDTMAGALLLVSDPTVSAQAATKNYVDAQVATSLPKAGGTLSGNLILSALPTIAAQAATKQYVDLRVLRSGDTLTGALVLAADPAAANQAATKNYVDQIVAASVAKSGASMAGSLQLYADPATPLEAGTKQYIDLRVMRAGDSLTGPLLLAADPISGLQAATKQYVDAHSGSGLSAAGASFTGPLLLASDPVSTLQAATKQYTDKRVLRTGDTMTGTLVLSADPVTSAGAATKGYVDAAVVKALPLTGGSLTGALLLGADPTNAVQAATKRYVDSQVLTALPLTGGTLTGAVTLSVGPSQAQHATNKQYVDAQLAAAVSVQGGSLTGPLLLSGQPTLPLHAAAKQYVDAAVKANRVINVAVSPYGAALDGVTDDTAAFKAAYQAASAGNAIYVPSGVVNLQQPSNWGVALNKRVKWLVDGTTLPDGTPLASAAPATPSSITLPGLVVGNTQTGFATSLGASDAADVAVSQSAYVVTHNGGTPKVITNHRTDTVILSSPGGFIWGGLDRLLWAGTQSPAGSIVAQHVGRYVQTVRMAAATDANGSHLPQPQLWTACLEYKDLTGQPSSSTAAAITVEMDWYGNGADDSNSRQMQSLVVGQANTSGLPVEVGTVIGVYLAGGSTGSVKNVLAIGIPFSNAVLDTTYARSINSAPVIRMSAGQAIAFEGTATNRLWYDSAFGVLKWSNGVYNNVVGKLSHPLIYFTIISIG